MYNDAMMRSSEFTRGISNSSLHLIVAQNLPTSLSPSRNAKIVAAETDVQHQKKLITKLHQEKQIRERRLHKRTYNELSTELNQKSALDYRDGKLVESDRLKTFKTPQKHVNRTNRGPNQSKLSKAIDGNVDHLQSLENSQFQLKLRDLSLLRSRLATKVDQQKKKSYVKPIKRT